MGMKKAFLALAAIGLMSSAALAVKGEVKVTGQGTIEPGRTFAISATLYPDGTASGQATLINKNFTGDSGKGPYKLRVDITCFKRLDANTVTLGGSTERTNDSSLVDAVFFTLQDNGNGNDKMSRAFFWDDDPDTQGDPAACQFVNAGDFPLEDVQQGNLNVK
jgi:hypothetical protein